MHVVPACSRSSLTTGSTTSSRSAKRASRASTTTPIARPHSLRLGWNDGDEGGSGLGHPSDPRRPWSQREVEIAEPHLLSAAIAAQVRADVAAAASVERESWRTFRCRVVAVAPLDQDKQHGAELASLVGEDVLRPARTLRVREALEHSFVAQQLEPVGEDVRCDPEAVLELFEAGQADDGVAEDQQRPTLADHFQRPRDRADLVW